MMRQPKVLKKFPDLHVPFFRAYGINGFVVTKGNSRWHVEVNTPQEEHLQARKNDAGKSMLEFNIWTTNFKIEHQKSNGVIPSLSFYLCLEDIPQLIASLEEAYKLLQVKHDDV